MKLRYVPLEQNLVATNFQSSAALVDTRMKGIAQPINLFDSDFVRHLALLSRQMLRL